VAHLAFPADFEGSRDAAAEDLKSLSSITLEAVQEHQS
jgi:hypothetical protein